MAAAYGFSLKFVCNSGLEVYVLMVDPRSLRHRRLMNEYNELMQFRNDVIQIEPLSKSPCDKYRITFNLQTIISPQPIYRNRTVCILTIPPGYPDTVPKISMDGDSMPPPWHVNWYRGGTWCFGTWTREESLVNYIYRCAKTIIFDPNFTDARYDASANKDAIAFWNANRLRRDMFPTDKKELPTAETQRETIRILEPEKLTIKFL